jgi:hypothetical protein
MHRVQSIFREQDSSADLIQIKSAAMPICSSTGALRGASEGRAD